MTCNLAFDGQDYVDAYIRILKKSCIIKGYWVDWFKPGEGRAKGTNPQADSDRNTPGRKGRPGVLYRFCILWAGIYK